MFCTFQRCLFLNRLRLKAEIFTDYVYWAEKLMNCTSVIIVGKMTEQSWKVSKKLHFCWPFTHGLAISEPFKMKSWNFQRLYRVKRYIDNLYFGNHSWKNDWAELEIVIFLYFFTIHTRSCHFWTVQDGKLKFSQYM